MLSKARRAVIKLSEEVVELLNMLHNYFARSPARKREMCSNIATENRTRVERQRQVQAEGRRAPRIVAAENPVPVLERILGVLEELHKLPKKIIMTRWLSCAEAVKVVLNSRNVYYNYFVNENRGQLGHSLVRLFTGRFTGPYWYERIVSKQRTASTFAVSQNKFGEGGLN
jgi:hypothetical protein